MFSTSPWNWNDLKSWPWSVWVMVLLMVANSLIPAWRWLARRLAVGWPSINATIDYAQVTKPSGNFLFRKRNEDPFTAEIAYSYRVNGNRGSGVYRRGFGTAAKARSSSAI